LRNIFLKFSEFTIWWQKYSYPNHHNYIRKFIEHWDKRFRVWCTEWKFISDETILQNKLPSIKIIEHTDEWNLLTYNDLNNNCILSCHLSGEHQNLTWFSWHLQQEQYQKISSSFPSLLPYSIENWTNSNQPYNEKDMIDLVNINNKQLAGIRENLLSIIHLIKNCSDVLKIWFEWVASDVSNDLKNLIN
jgi:hypothetical protein